VPSRRHFLCSAAALAAGAAPGAAPAAAGTPGAAAPRDVLDTPAQRSVLAGRGLINGLARAGRRVVAVGQRGHILTSDDAGASWQQAEVPVSSDLVAVCFPSATVGYACGHDGVVLASADGGRRWRRLLDGRRTGALMVEHYRAAAPAAAATATDPRLAAALKEAERFAAQGAENPWLDLWFADERQGFVVGAFGQVLHTRDGGASWQPWLHALDNPRGLHLYAVRGIGAELWIAGEQGLLLKLDRDTNRFHAVELPYKGTLFGVVGHERVLLVHGLRGTVLRSTDGGRGWQPVATGLQIGLPAATLDERGRLLLLSQAGHVLESRDDGASFAPVPGARPQPAAAVVAAAPGTLVLGGPRGLHTVTLP
jgi:photosystem II stability/assembly factor-like uncharacterized protein